MTAQPRAASGLGAYRRAFATAGAPAFVLAGIVGRYPRAMLSLGVILLIVGATGSYGSAAYATAALVIGLAIGAPFWSSRMDRHGQRPVLLVALLCLVASVTALVLVVTLRAPFALWLVAALAAGLSAPDFASAVRARWTAKVEGQTLTTAFAIETIGDQVVFVTGPPVITVLAATASPLVGIGVTLALGVAGALWLAALGGTEPGVVPRRNRSLLLPPPGVVPVIAACVLLGAMFGSFDVTVVGWAAGLGGGGLAGLVLAAMAVAIGVGSVVVGAREWRMPARARFIGFSAAAAVAAAFLPLAAGSLLLLVPVGVMGLCLAPVMNAAITLAAERAPEGRVTEVLAYPTAATSVGVPIGGIVAGSVLDAATPAAAFVVVASAVAGTFVVAGLGEGLIAGARRRRAAAA